MNPFLFLSLSLSLSSILSLSRRRRCSGTQLQQQNTHVVFCAATTGSDERTPVETEKSAQTTREPLRGRKGGRADIEAGLIFLSLDWSPKFSKNL
jgi:hypothetical protein